jgi:uncharacterized protein
MKVPRLIADINVLLPSPSENRKTLSSRLYDSFLKGETRLVFDRFYLDELERVLDYKRVDRFNITPGVILRLVRNLYEFGEPVYNIPVLDWPSLSDEKDWYLLDLLFASSADGLITQDKRVLDAGQKLGMPVFDLQGGAAQGWY